MQSRSISSPNIARRRLFLMLTISFLVTFMPEPTTAVPVSESSMFRVAPREPELPPISLKYFQDRIHKIDRDTCVFYYHLGLEAKAWAKTKTPPLNTVWWAFDPKTYLDTESPLRDYVRADKEVDYWELMCEAYTKACAGETWVLIKPEDPDEPQDSIWTRIEYATIKKQESGIVKVDRLDGKGENPRTIWTKLNPATKGVLRFLLDGMKLASPGGAKKGEPPSPMGGQPSMYQNGPPGGS